jgi:hypothetical protein
LKTFEHVAVGLNDDRVLVDIGLVDDAHQWMLHNDPPTTGHAIPSSPESSDRVTFRTKDFRVDNPQDEHMFA